MHLHQLSQVKLGGLEHLDLADVHVLQGVDAWGEGGGGRRANRRAGQGLHHRVR